MDRNFAQRNIESLAHVAHHLRKLCDEVTLATKLEAFKDRGQEDFLSSHDLEDIISLIDGRSEIINDVSTSPKNLREYLAFELSTLIHNNQFIQSLSGHLNYTHEAEDRKKIVLDRIQAIIDSEQ